jgi:ubiquinone/menaquinone biosynthesis C-methylase UbiE
MLNIKSIINQFDLKKDSIVTDLGSGIGHFTLPIAKTVAPDGHVYAVDVHRDILSRLLHDAEDVGITNIETVWGDVETPGGTHLKAESVDIVLFAHVLHQIKNRPNAIREALRILKPSGKIVIIDWQGENMIGPKTHKQFPLIETKKLCEHFGLIYLSEIVVGDMQYGILFAKK